MFTGIIEEKVRLKRFVKSPVGCKLVVESEIASKDAKIGESISLNGVCLTVAAIRGKSLSFDVMEETLRGTNLLRISVAEKINMERSLSAGDKISGHFVTGHIDCLGKVRNITKRPNRYAMDIELPRGKMVHVAKKGSITVDGVSLTVGELKRNRLTIYLIPVTLETTNLSERKRGDLVNIEFDILSKYISQAHTKNRINENFLKEHGFSEL